MPPAFRPSRGSGSGADRRADVVHADRMCTGCGYNLRGLPLAGRCPECGLPVLVPRSIDAPLSEMPVRLVKVFRRASLLASACAVAVIALVLLGRFWLRDDVVTATTMMALALLWILATCMLTPALDVPQAVVRGFSHSGRLRLAARGLQGGWILAAGVELFRALAPVAAAPASKALGAALLLGMSAGLLGIIVLGVLLQRLADWACDREAAAAFNLVVVGVPLSTILLFTFSPIFIVGLLLILLWVTSVAAFPYAMVSLARSTVWSVIHSREHQERLRRRQQRAEEYASGVERTVDEMDAARGPRGVG